MTTQEKRLLNADRHENDTWEIVQAEMAKGANVFTVERDIAQAWITSTKELWAAAADLPKDTVRDLLKNHRYEGVIH